MLETGEVLDGIKTRFFELDELTFGFTPAQKDKYFMLWVQNLKKMTGQIRKTAAKDALKQLQDEGLVLIGEAADDVQAWDWETAWVGRRDIKLFRWAGSKAARWPGRRGYFYRLLKVTTNAGLKPYQSLSVAAF